MPIKESLRNFNFKIIKTMFKKEILKPELEPEKEKEIETRIILEIMRHGKKEEDETKSNEELRLTQEGRRQADTKGKELKPQARVAVGWGSLRGRTQETAYRAMLATENLSPDASLEEIEKAISQEVKFGKKMILDERLNFNDKGPVGQEMNKAYDVGRYLPYIILQSDRRAIEIGDKETTTYTRMAANIAELVKRYAKVGNNFNRLASKTDEYEKFGNQLERYMGTHGGVVESFLAKILEKIQGVEKRDEFVKNIGSLFKETEGVHIELINKGKEQNILVDYEVNGKKERVEIDENLLNDIIEERKKLEEDIQNLNESRSYS